MFQNKSFNMNYFFLLNLAITLTVFFVPISRFSFSYDYFLDLTIKLFIFILLFIFVLIRGKTALKIKNGYLYCYSFPVVRKYKCTEIKNLELTDKKVRIFSEKKVIDVDYFFGIRNAIDDDVRERYSL